MCTFVRLWDLLQFIANHHEKVYTYSLIVVAMYQRAYVSSFGFPRQTMERVTLQNQLQQLLEAQKSESLLSSPR